MDLKTALLVTACIALAVANRRPEIVEVVSITGPMDILKTYIESDESLDGDEVVNGVVELGIEEAVT